MTVAVIDENQASNEAKGITRRRRPSRPLRRYGIEVDKIEDVGITVMWDGIHPRKSLTREEYESLPQEYRDKIKAETRAFFENSKTTFPAAIKEAVRNQLERGFPISYEGDDGSQLRRYPDGKIFSVYMNMETYETTETFLRMATPEDDEGIYD